MAEAVGGGKGRSGTAEEGVGESAGKFVGIFLVGLGRSGSVAGEFPVEKENDKEENEERCC